ncbi:MAG: CD225/dispanin family protein [Bacteroidaceae bacterium]|nr:CD225/dispanin family protein [Bacteroidaceae bacterium]
MSIKIITIGRSSSNDVNINDPFVSNSHCQIIQDDKGHFRLIDTNSKNGTFVNGAKRHGEVLLNKSDVVRIGNTTLPWQTYFNNVGEPTDVGGKTGTDGNNIIIFTGPKPSNYMVWAVLSTVFCCLPFGIVSIVYASKVDELWRSGKYEEAHEAASKARTWFWWSLGTSLLILVVYFISVMVLGICSGL